jgi:nucleoside-diphosphate-sugar epimerase
MNVLVTGATGFMGPHLVNRLVQEGHHVRALVRPVTDASTLESLGVEIVRGDVRDPGTVDRAITNCQLVFHLAARTCQSKIFTRSTWKEPQTWHGPPYRPVPLVWSMRARRVGMGL